MSQCKSEIKQEGKTYRCLGVEGHEGSHENGVWTWPPTAPAQAGERYVAEAQKLWDAIVDDDDCCIGNPEGAEFVEEKIVPKIAAFLAQFSVTLPDVTEHE